MLGLKNVYDLFFKNGGLKHSEILQCYKVKGHEHLYSLKLQG